MIIDFEFEMDEIVYFIFILVKNSNNTAYINKGRVVGFETSNLKKVLKI